MKTARTKLNVKRLKAPSRNVSGVSDRSQSRFLRDSGSGVLKTRPSHLIESKDEIRRSWQKTAALAIDMIQNNGQLRGASEQIIADTVGTGLTLKPKPNMQVFKWDSQQTREWAREQAAGFAAWFGNKSECDILGDLNGYESVELGLRQHLAFGEMLCFFDHMPKALRDRYGISTAVKFGVTSPNKLVQDTNESQRLFQGVFRDENNRVSDYYLKTGDRWGSKVKRRAFDDAGRPMTMLIFERFGADDQRGISVLASQARQFIQGEMLYDATLQAEILQTVYAQVITSEKPSETAFEALELLKESNAEVGNKYIDEYAGYILGALDRAADSEISTGTDPRFSYLAPGESLEFKTPDVTGEQFLPLSKALDRKSARTLGLSYGSYSMDHESATYASTRMESATVYPVTLKRRNRIAAPAYQAAYELYLEERIATGKTTIPGGYQAFKKFRNEIVLADWSGPQKPSADDLKSAKAASERIYNGTSDLVDEAAEIGKDFDLIAERRQEHIALFKQMGLPNPYLRPGSVSSDAIEEDQQDNSRRENQ